MKVKSLSCVRLLATPWTAAYQAPPSTGFSRQEYWSGVPLPSPNNTLAWPSPILKKLSVSPKINHQPMWKKRSRNYKDTFCLLIKILCFEDTAANRKKENHSGDGSSEGQRLHSQPWKHIWPPCILPLKETITQKQSDTQECFQGSKLRKSLLPSKARLWLKNGYLWRCIWKS